MRNERTYLLDFLGLNVVILVRIWIIAQVFRAAFRSASVETIDGLSLSNVIWMVGITQAVGALIGNVELRVSEEVQDGSIAYLLARPISYVGYHYARFLGNAAALLPISILSSSLVVWLLVGPIQISMHGALAALLVMAGGATLHFVICLLIGLLAFWFEDISAFGWIYQKLWILFGGMVLPLDIFPQQIRWVAELSPFPHLFHAAARLCVSFSTPRFMQILAVQAIWLILTGSALFLLQRRAASRLVLNGG
ncbi:MAG: ABC-2 family transporter protein [Oligoflexia bacterium]|nr:ABC-2 family transporter protein [Oligoflexia bacterium]